LSKFSERPGPLEKTECPGSREVGEKKSYKSLQQRGGHKGEGTRNQIKRVVRHLWKKKESGNKVKKVRIEQGGKKKRTEPVSQKKEKRKKKRDMGSQAKRVGLHPGPKGEIGDKHIVGETGPSNNKRRGGTGSRGGGGGRWKKEP